MKYARNHIYNSPPPQSKTLFYTTFPRVCGEASFTLIGNQAGMFTDGIGARR